MNESISIMWSFKILIISVVCFIYPFDPTPTYEALAMPQCCSPYLRRFAMHR